MVSGPTRVEAWRGALDQAAAVGMVPERLRPPRGEDEAPLRSTSDNTGIPRSGRVPDSLKRLGFKGSHTQAR
jgi:hypothetical protein